MSTSLGEFSINPMLLSLVTLLALPEISSQTLTNTPRTTETPTLITFEPYGCGDCFFQAATAPPTKDQSLTSVKSSRSNSRKANSSITVTAYSVTSAIQINGSCTTINGPHINLTSPYVIAVPTANTKTDPRKILASSLADALGFSTCTGSGVQDDPTALLPVYRTELATLSKNLNSTTPVATTATSVPPNMKGPSSVLGYSGSLTIVLSVVIPIGSILVLALGFLGWRMSRKKRRSEAEKGNEKTQTDSEDSHPYLQPKAELEDAERQKKELEAKERRFELSGESHEVQELEADNPAQEVGDR